MNRLKNKIALITGAARGIGAATAELYIQEGAEVLLTDIRDDEGLALAERLGSKAHYHHLDVSQENAWVALSQLIKSRYQGIDILFNNAGIIGMDNHEPQDPEHLALETWNHIHSINLNGVFLGCKYGIGLMKEKGGSIINMSSRSGVVGIPTAAAYASSKAAVRNHTKSVALYCAQHGYKIRCNSVHPGAILTPLWDPMLGANTAERQAAINAIAQGIPLGHMGCAMDVAYAAVYLGSNESNYVTGIELTLDGGILAGSSAAPTGK